MSKVRLIVASALVALATSFAFAQRPAPDRARAWLHEAADAVGGESRLRAISASELSGLSVWQQREQSERPEGPWVETFNDFTDLRNFDANAIRRTTRARGYSTPDWVNNRDWLPDATILILAGVGLRRVDGHFEAAGTPWDVGAMPLDLGPEKLIVTALDAEDVHADADVAFHGYAHHVVSFTDRGAHVRVFLNPFSKTPAAVEITRPRPYETFWAAWGDVTTRLTFGQWLLEPEGVRLPRLWEYSTRGQLDGTVTITRVRLAPRIDAADFTIADDVRQQFVVNRRRIADVPFGNPQRPPVELAPGIVRVPANWDITEVKQDDGIVILESPLTSTYSTKAIDDARKRFGGLPIKAAITTSDSWPHIGGAREYVARGVSGC